MSTPRRTTAAALAASVVALTACTSDAGPDTVGATEACAAPVTPQLQEGGHLLGDTPPPVPYSSVPPTSGWHASGAPPAAGTYGTPLPDPQLVLWLETGGVYVAHRPDVDSDLARELAQLPDAHDQLLVSVHEGELPGPVVLAAWGVLQVCETVDDAALTTFVEAYGGVDRSD